MRSIKFFEGIKRTIRLRNFSGFMFGWKELIGAAPPATAAAAGNTGVLS